ncbi:unnamed protein product [Clonostachys rosea f. rosea IK726]|uniref:Uncharacterized protein n=2 Tax=Bionectria ochroleuca TaxID=29856 RepID=A0A0B7K2E4_BIOOC|nr:unnamed protein product [Clonostachys rosea f. rosea IK726]
MAKMPPPTPRKMQRIASQLGKLSLELVEPIISTLPLHKALDLMMAPLGPDAAPGLLLTHRQLSPLVQAFISSPTWKHIFRDTELATQILLVWEGLNRIFKLCHGNGYSNIIKETNPAFFPWARVQSTWRILGQGADQIADGDWLLAKLEGALWSMAVPGEQTAIFSNRPSNAAFMILPPEYGALPNSPTIDALPPQDQIFADQAGLPLFDLFIATPRLHEFQTTGWDLSTLFKYIGDLEEAWKMLKSRWTLELQSLEALYKRYPTMLKAALRPQVTQNPMNKDHIPRTFQRAIRKFEGLGLRGNGQWPFLFQFSHHYLVPYNWCLRLFRVVLDEKNPKIPPEFGPDLERAVKGLSYVQKYGGGDNLKYPRIRGSQGDARHMEFEVHVDKTTLLPASQAELQWLISFLTVVRWMESKYFDLAEELRRPVARIYRVGKGRGQKRFRLNPEDYKNLAESLPAREVAAYLKKDAELTTRPMTTNKARYPSLLAFFMPDIKTPKAQDISKYLTPQEGMSKEIQKIVYESTIERIKRHFGRPLSPPPKDSELLVHEALDENTPSIGASSGSTEWAGAVRDYANVMQKKPTSPSHRCYICRHPVIDERDLHPIFTAMCKPCGNFNLAGSSMSLPGKLDLNGKTAFVTGGRINLGFHTALRLLRCGAKVIVSSRYPQDAFVRYRNQPDSAEWLDNRLCILGADFRTANDAFQLAKRVRAALSIWAITYGYGTSVLDIMVNNAAQTLTDSNEKEEAAVNKESHLAASLPQHPALPAGTSYTPRVGGGASANNFIGNQSGGSLPPTSASTSAIQLAPGKSSWVQDLTEIPYADVVTAQAVNAFVPLILIRELLPLMSRSLDRQPGQIINVSSREGIFEDKRDHSAKQGKHVHTNMSKAALNMITETLASSSWKDYYVAMNTVDPGYMSAAPEMEHLFDGVRPLGWEDGAGRVLWPVAMAYGQDKTAIWGRFLKHYGAVGVTPGLG